MNLKYVVVPKPDEGQSTILKRIAMVFYGLGVLWFSFWFFVGPSIDGPPDILFINYGYAVMGIIGFAIGRGLLYILANR